MRERIACGTCTLRPALGYDRQILLIEFSRDIEISRMGEVYIYWHRQLLRNILFQYQEKPVMSLSIENSTGREGVLFQ